VSALGGVGVKPGREARLDATFRCPGDQESGVTSSASIPDAAALDASLHRFGHVAFRPGQREAVETLLDVGRLLLVAPTGGGKSLTYQLPASLLPGTTLVVSPLIALMHDQVTALEGCGVAATYLASTLDASETARRLAAVAKGEFQLAYVAPERLSQAGFRSLLADLACPLVAIDEAHCISEWGHDFRPDYHQIGEVITRLPEARVLACTATATPFVRDEILAKLGLPPDTPQLVTGFARPNLSLRAAEVGGKAERNRQVDAALAEALGAPGSARGKAIVYAPTRRGAEEASDRLGSRGWRADFYHAGRDGDARREVQSAFTRGDLDMVVATNAFGMGIDEPDVRAVVHLGPPASLEAYYQEVGRAGRDGEPALGLLLFAGNDLPLRRSLLERGENGEAPRPEVVEHKWNLFLELMRWAEGGSCRHDAILRYFADEAETLAGCGVCDVCTQLVAEEAPAFSSEDAALIVRKALSGVARAHGRYGLGLVVKLLRGEKDERLTRSGLARVTTFGVLAEHGADWLTRLLRRCVTAGFVNFAGEDRPVVCLTESGARVMRGERPPRLVLPALRRVRAPARAASSRGGRIETDAPATPAEIALFEALRAHRLELAKQLGVPPYVVAHDRTLHDLARLRPRTREELLLVDGIGPAKAERYGDGLLQVVREQS
jgi:ATP-dependent DNA helicase RecQ